MKSQNTPHESYTDWPEQFREIVEVLRPLLAQRGARFYGVGVRGQVRVGWTSGSINRLLATINRRETGVLLTLRVGRNSGLIGNGGLDVDRHPDIGRIQLQSKELPPELSQWIETAFEFNAQRFGLSSGQLGTSDHEDRECSPAVADAIADAGWSDPVTRGATGATILMQGEESFYVISLSTDDDPPLLTCVVSGSEPLPLVRRRRLFQAILRANAALSIGRFDLDTDTGELQFHASVPLHDTRVGTEAVELLAYFGVAKCDQYLPQFWAVVEGEIGPSEIA